MEFSQVYSKVNVLEASKERISFIFDNFNSVIVSVSGGKDSTVLAYLALQEAIKRNRKVGLFFLDEEVVYDSTIEQIQYLMNLHPENTVRLWYQIPFYLTNSTSLKEGQLIAWEKGKHEIWMRPKVDFSIKVREWSEESQTIRNKNKGFGFYDVIENFERAHPNTAFLVGLRATESPNRWRAVSKNPVYINDKPIFWATEKENNSISAYPLYDWNFTDIWRYIKQENIRYSKVYDRLFKMGVPVSEIRVSSLIHEKSFKALTDLPAIEPSTYDRLLKRIKGIALAQETARNNKLFKARKLPKNHASWQDYRDHLLKTHPDEKAKHIFEIRFSKQYSNEYVARQQVRQLLLNDYENNLPIENKLDPREEKLNYYRSIL